MGLVNTNRLIQKKVCKASLLKPPSLCAHNFHAWKIC